MFWEKFLIWEICLKVVPYVMREFTLKIAIDYIGFSMHKKVSCDTVERFQCRTVRDAKGLEKLP